MGGSVPTVLLIILGVLLVLLLLLGIALLYFQIKIIRLIRVIFSIPRRIRQAFARRKARARRKPRPEAREPTRDLISFLSEREELKLITYSYQTRIDTRYESFEDAHWSWKWLLNRKETISVTGEVLALFDLQRVFSRQDSVEVDGQKVVMALPACELRVSIDEASLQKHTRKRGLFAELSERDKRFDSHIRLHVEEKLKKAAREEGRIEEKALESLSRRLNPLVRMRGYADVQFVIEPGMYKTVEQHPASLPPSA